MAGRATQAASGAAGRTAEDPAWVKDGAGDGGGLDRWRMRRAVAGRWRRGWVRWSMAVRRPGGASGRGGELAQPGPDGGESGAPCAGDVGIESQKCDRIGVGPQAREGSRIGIAEEVAGQQDQSAHQRRLAVAPKRRWGVRGAGDPDPGLAAVDSELLGPETLFERGRGSGALDDRGEPFLGVLDELQPVDQVLLARRERHAGTVVSAW